MISKALLILFTLFISVSAIAQGNPIKEAKFVTIGGIEQWITIKGNDSSKPVILFIHGGPGSVMSPFDDAVYGSWEKEFILVNWDQRGAGRTYGRNAPEEADEDFYIENPLTVEQMAADGIELAEFLTQHLGKQKIILAGTSWGSVLSTKMALQRPDLFHAYIGHAQIVNFIETLKSAFRTVLKMAKKAGDKEAVEKLETLGAPPYAEAKNAGQLFRIIKKYERANEVPAPDSWWKLAPEYANEKDAKNRYDGDDYSFIHFVGHEKLGIKSMGATIDFMNGGTEFEIPVYFVQGEGDILTPREISKEYFEKIKAPKKGYFLVKGAAHGHNQAVVDMQYKVLKEYVLPSIK